MHGHLVPHLRQAVAEGVHGAARVGPERIGRDEYHAGSAQRQQGVALAHHADADRASGIVAAAGRHGHGVHAPESGNLATQPAGDFRTLMQDRHMLDPEPAGREDLLAPATPPHVEPERARTVGDVGRAVAGHSQPHVVLGQQDRARRGEQRRLVTANPEELRRGETGHREVAGDRMQIRHGGLELAALGEAAAIVPEYGGTQRPLVLAQQRGAVHLPREADAAHRPAQRRVDGADRGSRCRPPAVGVLLGPEVPGTRHDEWCCALAGNGTVIVQHDGLHRRCSDIDSEVHAQSWRRCPVARMARSYTVPSRQRAAA